MFIESYLSTTSSLFQDCDLNITSVAVTFVRIFLEVLILSYIFSWSFLQHI